MLEVIHQGRVLTQEQLEVLKPVLEANLSPRNLRKAVDIALAKAGMSVPPLKVNDLVGWSVRDIVDQGRIVDIDVRADKIRVLAKSKGRPVTVPGRVVRFMENGDDSTTN